MYRNEYINGIIKYNSVIKARNTAEYVIARLADLGIRHYFGVADASIFSVNNSSVVRNPLLTKVQCSNELNAVYAADGYARIKGAAILSTRYEGSEPCTLNGAMRAKRENVLIFHLVDIPAKGDWNSNETFHYPAGDNKCEQLAKLWMGAYCMSVVITPENCVREMDRVISEAFTMRQPVYIAIAVDDALLPLSNKNKKLRSHVELPGSDLQQLEIVTDFLVKIFQEHSVSIAFPCFNLSRYNLSEKAFKLVKKLNCPYITTPMNKGIFDEGHRLFYGMYRGEDSDLKITKALDKADLILDLGGTLLHELDYLGFSFSHLKERVITFSTNYIKFQKVLFKHIYLENILDNLIDCELSACVSKLSIINKLPFLNEITPGIGIAEPITFNKAFQLINEYILRDGDALMIDNKDFLIALTKLRFKSRVEVLTSLQWQAFEWASSAAIGTLSGASPYRVVIIINKDRFPAAVCSIFDMIKYDMKPLIILFNDQGLTKGNGLAEYSCQEFNNLCMVNFTNFIKMASNNKWFTAKVETIPGFIEVSEAIVKINRAVFIEIILERQVFLS